MMKECRVGCATDEWRLKETTRRMWVEIVLPAATKP